MLGILISKKKIDESLFKNRILKVNFQKHLGKFVNRENKILKLFNENLRKIY